MNHFWIVLGLPLLWAGVISAAERPAYVCTGQDKVVYQLFTPNNPRLVVVSATSRREVPLSPKNFGRPYRLEPGLYYYEHWEKKGRTIYSQLDFSNAVRVHLYRETAPDKKTNKNGETIATIQIVLDHREILGLECEKATHQVPVFGLDAKMPLMERLVQPIYSAGYLPERNGKLAPVSILGFEATLRRFFALKDSANLNQQFLEVVGNSIRLMPETSLLQVRSRLKAPERKAFDKLVTLAKYESLSEVSRYIEWIRAGRDLLSSQQSREAGFASIAAGLGAFLNSNLSSVAELRKYFAKEAEPLVRALSIEELAAASFGLELRNRALVLHMWRSGNPTQLEEKNWTYLLQTVDAMIKDLQVYRGKSSYVTFIEQLFKFQDRKDLMENPLTRKYLVYSVAPQVKKLKPSQVKIVAGYMVPETGVVFREMQDVP